MKILSAIAALAGAVCLVLAVVLGIGGFSEYQRDQAFERFPAEVASLRAEGDAAYPVVRYNLQGTDYQMIVKNHDYYQGEKLLLIFPDGTPSSMTVYRDSPLAYDKILGAIFLFCAGVTFFAADLLLLRAERRVRSGNPRGILPPLLLGVSVTALCVLLVVNVFCYLPQNRDNEKDYVTVNATLIMAPENDGDTVARYTYNGKTYKAKVSKAKDNYVGREIPLYIKYRDPGFAKEKLNDVPFLTATNVAVGTFGIVCFILSLFPLKAFKKNTGKKTAP